MKEKQMHSDGKAGAGHHLLQAASPPPGTAAGTTAIENISPKFSSSQHLE